MNSKLNVRIKNYIGCSGFTIKPEHCNVARNVIVYNNAKVLSLCFTMDLGISILVAVVNGVMIQVGKGEYVHSLNSIIIANYANLACIYLGYSKWDSRLPKSSSIITDENPFKLSMGAIATSFSNSIKLAFKVDLSGILNVLANAVDNHLCQSSVGTDRGNIVLKGPEKPTIKRFETIGERGKPHLREIMAIFGCVVQGHRGNGEVYTNETESHDTESESMFG